MGKSVLENVAWTAVLLGVFLLVAGNAAAGDDPDYIYAARKTVDVYTTPADTAEVLKSLPLGTIMIEMETLPTGWVKIQTMDGVLGWVEEAEVAEDMPTRVFAQHHTVAVRFCPTLECPEIERVGFDSEIMQLDEDDDWIQVVLPNGVVGWVEEDAVSDKPPKRYVVLVPTANLRSCPSESCPLLTSVSAGSVLIRMDKKDDWYLVFTGEGVSGWIYEDLVVREEKASQIPGLMNKPAGTAAQPQG